MGRYRLLVLAASLLLAAAPLLAGVDMEVGNNARIDGTLSPADQLEVFRVRLPAGSLLTVSAKGRKPKGGGDAPVIGVRVLDPDEGQLAKGTGVKKLAILKTGVHTIAVSGDGVTAGDYQLKIKWKAPKKVPADGETGAEELAIPFGAGAGTTAKIAMKAAKKSAAEPRLLRIEGPGEFVHEFGEPAPSKASGVLLPSFGEYTLFVGDAGETGGAITGTVKLKGRKAKKQKIDLRGAEAAGGDTAVGLLLDEGGGEVTVTEEQSPQLAGAGVSVPAGALTAPVAVYVGTTAEIEPPAEGIAPAGPPVLFGPEGTTFAEPVTITLPYDPAAAGGDADQLTVLRRDRRGRVTGIEPEGGLDFDPEAGLVSLDVTSFSSYGVFAPAGAKGPAPGDLNADGVGDLVIPAPGKGPAGEIVVLFGGAGLSSTRSVDADALLHVDEGVSGLGRDVVLADLNGDGISDLAASGADEGGPGNPGEPPYDGVYVWFGGKSFRGGTAPDRKFVSEEQEDFGIRIAAGDVSGDGVADLVVSGPMRDDGRGAVYVFFGGETFESGPAGTADVILTGAVPGDLFGATVAVGDVTGDGIADLIAGADQGGRAGEAGQVLVFPGGSDLKSGSAADAPIVLTGDVPGAGFGIEIAVGDLTGEGIGDLAIAASVEGAGSETPGTVWVFFGGPALATKTAEAADRVVTGEVAGDRFGTMLDIADVSGGPVPDLVVGAGGNDAGGKDAGRIYVFRGGNEFPARDAEAADVAITGEKADDFLTAILPLVDVTGDGIPDLAIAAPKSDEGGADGGRAYVFTGGPALVTTGAGNAGVIVTGGPGENLGGGF